MTLLTMLKIAFLGTLATITILLGCSCEPVEPSRLEAAIVNGTVDPGHPAVGVQTVQGELWCTATLIGTRTVLTAAHCVVPEEKPPYTLSPQQGFSLDGVATPIPAASVTYHPGYDAVNIDNDVAVIRLSQDVPGITPVQLATTAPVVGETIEIVGYGVTSEYAEDDGTKRRTQNTVGLVTPTQYVFYGASGSVGSHCYGDSGGPSFAVRGGKQLQVGVHSWGEDVCGVAEHDTRVDAFYGWIKQQAQGDLYDGNAAPTVTIVSPAPNATVPSAFQVDVSVHDDVGVVRVELTVDDQLLDAQQQPQGSCQLEVSGLAAGLHRLRVEAIDAGGLRGSAKVSVTVQSAGAGGDPDSAQQQPGAPQGPAGAPSGPGVVEITGACAFVPTDPPAAAPWVLLLALLRARRRRRCGTNHGRRIRRCCTPAAVSSAPPAASSTRPPR
jgi:V8-like Glu-specific endopeptidase